MMIRKYIQGLLIMGSLSCAATTSFAAEASRVVTISLIAPNASSRPSVPASQNMTFIKVNSAAWGGLDCNHDYAALRTSEPHMLSVLLTAWTTGKQISLTVEGSSKPYADICEVVSMDIQN